jgi:mannosyl-3-phosphoglycerate phosphatase
MRWTGLARADAQKAMQREATEPLLWHDSDSVLAQFRQRLMCLNLQCVRGGRFYHVMGTFDKASCFKGLKDYYARRWQDQVGIIALGDSQNDLPMLEQADISIVIPSRHGRKINPNGNRVYFASQPSPHGWQEGIEDALKSIV